MRFVNHGQMDAVCTTPCERLLKRLGYGTLAECDTASEGKESMVLLPHARPDRVVKVANPTQSPILRKKFQNEVMRLRELSGMHGDDFVLPRYIASGEDPDFVVMSRLGPTLSRVLEDPSLLPWKTLDTKTISRAVGQFSAHLYEQSREVNIDIHPGNLTLEPDGRVGIIDLSLVVKDSPEMAFCALLAEKPNLVPDAVDQFERITGIWIDPYQVMDSARLIQKFKKVPDPEKERTILANMLEWQEETRPSVVPGQMYAHTLG